jgi:hypothetical protein
MDNQSDAAKRTLAGLGYTWDGEYWHPPTAMPPAADDPAARDIAVMVIMRTTDVSLFPESLDRATKALRRAVIANLPKITRIVTVMDEETAKLMCTAHAFAAQASGLATIRRPPADYRGPHDGVAPRFP